MAADTAEPTDSQPRDGCALQTATAAAARKATAELLEAAQEPSSSAPSMAMAVWTPPDAPCEDATHEDTAHDAVRGLCNREAADSSTKATALSTPACRGTRLQDSPATQSGDGRTTHVMARGAEMARGRAENMAHDTVESMLKGPPQF